MERKKSSSKTKRMPEVLVQSFVFNFYFCLRSLLALVVLPTSMAIVWFWSLYPECEISTVLKSYKFCCMYTKHLRKMQRANRPNERLSTLVVLYEIKNKVPLQVETNALFKRTRPVVIRFSRMTRDTKWRERRRIKRKRGFLTEARPDPLSHVIIVPQKLLLGTKVKREWNRERFH